MLVLSRKADEEIRIGDRIRVRVLKVSGNSVRLGIDAPLETKVLRAELEIGAAGYDRLSSSRNESGSADSDRVPPKEDLPDSANFAKLLAALQ